MIDFGVFLLMIMVATIVLANTGMLSSHQTYWIPCVVELDNGDGDNLVFSKDYEIDLHGWIGRVRTKYAVSTLDANVNVSSKWTLRDDENRMDATVNMPETNIASGETRVYQDNEPSFYHQFSSTHDSTVVQKRYDQFQRVRPGDMLTFAFQKNDGGAADTKIHIVSEVLFTVGSFVGKRGSDEAENYRTYVTVLTYLESGSPKYMGYPIQGHSRIANIRATIYDDFVSSDTYVLVNANPDQVLRTAIDSTEDVSTNKGFVMHTTGNIAPGIQLGVSILTHFEPTMYHMQKDEVMPIVFGGLDNVVLIEFEQLFNFGAEVEFNYRLEHLDGVTDLTDMMIELPMEMFIDNIEVIGSWTANNEVNYFLHLRATHGRSVYENMQTLTPSSGNQYSPSAPVGVPASYPGNVLMTIPIMNGEEYSGDTTIDGVFQKVEPINTRLPKGSLLEFYEEDIDGVPDTTEFHVKINAVCPYKSNNWGINYLEGDYIMDPMNIVEVAG